MAPILMKPTVWWERVTKSFKGIIPSDLRGMKESARGSYNEGWGWGSGVCSRVGLALTQDFSMAVTTPLRAEG